MIGIKTEIFDAYGRITQIKTQLEHDKNGAHVIPPRKSIKKPTFNFSKPLQSMFEKISEPTITPSVEIPSTPFTK